MVAVIVWLLFLIEVVLRRAFEFSGIRIMWLPLAGGVTLLLLYNRVRTRVESELLVVFFDPDDRVREVSLRRVEGRR